MADDADQTNLPNAGRMYDYSLGGNHNFEADRQAAEFMISLVPSSRKWVRMLRMFLQEAIVQLAEQGFDKFLDLASGLPTEDHISSRVPGAHVIYVDSDPVVVAYGTEILGDNPSVRYIQEDIRNIDNILSSPAIQALFGDDRKVVFGLNAITCFLSEEELQHILRALYDWAAPGSRLFASFETKTPGAMTPKMKQFTDTFAQLGSPYYFMTLEQAQELVKPWTPDQRGFQPLGEWLGIEDQISEADREGVGLEFYGAIFEK